jgi:uncharacterized protein YjbI with pentapeptide repeats
MIEIRHRFTSAILLRSETATTIRGALEELVAGEPHQKWLRSEAGGVRANLAGAYLARAYLARAYLAGANLADANLAGANLARANLAGANLADANLAGAYLARAYLAGAHLAGANLADANLAGANLARANLAGANLADANLAGAYLARAYLAGAHLDGANLADAYLARAYLARAYLAGAHLDGAHLDGAHLDGIREDIYEVLSDAPAEVPGLLAAIREGRMNGSTYSGECACLVGTIANVRGCPVGRGARPSAFDLGVRIDSHSPAEIWFLGIKQGDTPETSQISSLTAAWVESWLLSNPEVV